MQENPFKRIEPNINPPEDLEKKIVNQLRNTDAFLQIAKLFSISFLKTSINFKQGARSKSVKSNGNSEGKPTDNKTL